MVTPLKVQRTQPASRGVDRVLGIVVGGPLIYLVWLLRTGQTLHFENPFSNALAHALIVVLPATMGCLVVRTPLRFADTSESLLVTQSYTQTFQQNWWMLAPLWPAAVLAVVIVLSELPMIFGGGVEHLSTSAYSALFTVLLVFILVAFFGGMLNLKFQIRLSGEGLRFGMTRFVVWDQVGHIRDLNRFVEVYHKDCPTIPFETILTSNPPVKLALEKSLSEHNVPRSSKGSVQFIIFRASILFVSVAMFGIGLYLLQRRICDPRWLIILILVAGGLVTFGFERIRGLSSVTRVYPDLSDVRQD
jgi:hypothetical protein